MAASLPTVVVPVFNGLAALDACLAALERSLPAGAAVLLADDASSDPQVEPLARGWCQRRRLASRYRRGDRRLGFAGNCRAALAESGEADIVLLHADALATPGWLEQLARCAASEPRSASISAWSNQDALCSFPRPGDAAAAAEFPETVAQAVAELPWTDRPELPAISGACLYLRGTALRQLGGLDSDSYWGERVLDDFCRRAAAMGWRNVLCPAAYVSRQDAPAAPAAFTGDDLAQLLARWPDFQEQVARFILSDPLRPLRERLRARLDELARGGPQRDLFH